MPLLTWHAAASRVAQPLAQRASPFLNAQSPLAAPAAAPLLASRTPSSPPTASGLAVARTAAPRRRPLAAAPAMRGGGARARTTCCAVATAAPPPDDADDEEGYPSEDAMAQIWQTRFEEYAAFASEHRTDPPTDTKVGRWAERQRALHAAGKLRASRIAALNSIGFDWTQHNSAATGGASGRGGAGPRRPYRPDEDAKWRQHMDELRAYKAAHHGDTNVPHVYKDNTQLGLWVEKCRRIRNSLSPERVAELDALGFDWAPHETAWEAHFQQLKHAHDHGGAMNKPLRDWATMQRMKRARGELSAERVAQLNSIGFEWDPLENAWDEHYEALVAYKVANGGSVAVPETINGVHNPLGNWLSNQLARWRAGTLAPERVAALQALAVPSLPKLRAEHAADWNEWFLLLLAYAVGHGGIHAPSSDVTAQALASWLAAQCDHWTRGTLEPGRAAKLAALGVRKDFPL
jgi:hypothetical protein